MPKNLTNGEKVQYAALHNANLTKDQISDWLRKDIESAYCLMAELLNDKSMIDSLANVLFARYKNYHEQKEKEATNVR